MVITTGDERRDWPELRLRRRGHRPFPMQAFFNQDAGSQDVGLVLLDGQCLSRQQVDQLLPFLADLGVPTARLPDRGAHAPRGAEHLPTVPVVFTRGHLDARLALRPAWGGAWAEPAEPPCRAPTRLPSCALTFSRSGRRGRP